MTRAAAVLVLLLAGTAATPTRRQSRSALEVRIPRTVAHVYGRIDAIARDGGRIGWIVTDPRGCLSVRALVRRRTMTLARGACDPAAAAPNDARLAIAGRAALWTTTFGGNTQTTDVWTIGRARRARRLDEWSGPPGDPLTGSFLGGVAGGRTLLVYARVDVTTSNETQCMGSDVPCRTRVTGGGTYRVDPRTAGRRRMFPPAHALAEDRGRLAVAVGGRVIVIDRRGRRDTIRTTGIALALDGPHVAVLGVTRRGGSVLTLWDVRRARKLRSVRLPPLATDAVGLSGDVAVVATQRGLERIDLTAGRRTLIAPMRGVTHELDGFVVERGQLTWAETRAAAISRSIVRTIALG